MRRAILGVAAALVLGWLLPAPARAQDPEPEKQAPLAEALFRDGRALMEAGRFAEACPKLAESQRVDPHLGTLLNLAACHELEGRTATAWAEYTEARSQASHAGRADRESFARAHAQALEPRLSRVVVRTDRPLEGLEVDIDGEALGAGVLGTALPVDPGHHVLRATAPGHAPWSTSFDAAAGPATQTVRIPPLAPAAPAAPIESPAPAAAPATIEPPPAASEAPTVRSHAPTALFWGVAAAGAVAAGVGSAFGIMAFDQNDQAQKQCPSDTCTTTAGRNADSNARTDATVSTVAFGVALAAATGAGLIIAIGHDDAPSVRVSLTPGGVGLGGTW